MTAYATWDAAARRVEVLKAKGTWPGIVGPDALGFYRLTCDPYDGATVTP